jgi:hypothetical protein
MSILRAVVKRIADRASRGERPEWLIAGSDVPRGQPGVSGPPLGAFSAVAACSADSKAATALRR